MSVKTEKIVGKPQSKQSDKNNGYIMAKNIDKTRLDQYFWFDGVNGAELRKIESLPKNHIFNGSSIEFQIETDKGPVTFTNDSKLLLV